MTGRRVLEPDEPITGTLPLPFSGEVPGDCPLGQTITEKNTVPHGHPDPLTRP